MEVDLNKHELIVCSRKDLRIFNMENGRMKKLFTGLLENEEDDICVFKTYNQFKKFILGDYKGGINIYNV